MLTLYHAPQSRSSRIVWLLEELEAPYELKIVDIPRMDGSGKPDPSNPHPDKKVPAIVDDGALVTESAAICLYLTDKFPAKGIGPIVGDPLRGPYLSWLVYNAGVIEMVMHMEFCGLMDIPALRRTFRGREEVDARILAALTAGPYLLGERFSAVDALIGSTGMWMRQMMPNGKVVDDYLARLAARPALARANAKDGTIPT
jgi:glutathione S-transferase